MYRTARPAAQLVTVVVAVAVAMSACSSDESSSSDTTSEAPITTAAPIPTMAPTTEVPTTEVPTTEAPATDAPTTTEAPATTVAPTLEEQIAADFQGVQLDVIGGAPAPGGTTMFFQVGDWAAMANWLTADTWCVSDVYDWTVTDATSPTEFTVDYVRSAVFPECADQDFNKQFALRVSGVREEDGRTIYDGTYEFPGGIEFPAVRTVCSVTWDDPDRCGIDTLGLEVPAPPAV